jgi:hypothetical protein
MSLNQSHSFKTNFSKIFNNIESKKNKQIIHRQLNKNVIII